MRSHVERIIVALMVVCSSSLAISPATAPATRPSTAPSNSDVQAKPRRVVFLCEASGTMVVAMPTLRRALNAEMEGLTMRDRFNVVMFHDHVAEMLPGENRTLVQATPQTVGRAQEWVKRYGPQGTTDPLPAIRVAFSLAPTEISVLTDGFDNVGSYAVVRKAFKEANRGGKVKVNVLYLKSRLGDADLDALLRQIADDSGGTYREIATK